MSVTVNPPPQMRIPKAFIGDREMVAFFDQQRTILSQLRAKTGGDTDFVAELETYTKATFEATDITISGIQSDVAANTLNIAGNTSDIADANSDISDNTADIATNTAAIATINNGLQKTYWFDDNDSATTGTPIAHVGGGLSTFLTNDGLGTQTNQYNPDAKSRLWDSVLNEFDLSPLKIGDVVMLRVDLLIETTSPNQLIDLFVDFAIGHANEYSINFAQKYYKTAAAGYAVSANIEFYVGNSITRDYPAKIRLTSGDDANIIVNGWYTRVTSV